MSEPQEAVKAGWTYAMFNHSIPNVVKIGETENLEERRKGLSASTSVPTPFIILCAVYVPDCYKLEQELHAFYSHRKRGKEFFTISHEEVVKKFLTLDGEPWVPPAPTVVRDPSVIGWAGGGRHMTLEEKEASGIDVKAQRDRNHNLEISKTGLEEAAALDDVYRFNSLNKQKAYEPKLLVMRHICAALCVAHTREEKKWSEAEWADILVACTTERTWDDLPEDHPRKTSSLISRAKWTFGRTDSDKKQIGADMCLAHDLNGILEAWTGSTLKNEGVATDGRKATSPIKVALGPPLPNYTTWAAEMRETLKAEGLKGNAVSSEIGKRWAALKSAVGYIAPKSVHIKKFVLRP